MAHWGVTLISFSAPLGYLFIDWNPMIQFTHRVLENGIVIVALGGHLDGAACEYFFECMQSVLEDGHQVIVVDVNELGYVSSLGLGMLIRGQSRLRRRGGELHLANVQGAVAEALRITHLNRLFDIHDSVEAAIAAVSSEEGQPDN